MNPGQPQVSTTTALLDSAESPVGSLSEAPIATSAAAWTGNDAPAGVNSAPASPLPEVAAMPAPMPMAEQSEEQDSRGNRADPAVVAVERNSVPAESAPIADPDSNPEN